MQDPKRMIGQKPIIILGAYIYCSVALIFNATNLIAQEVEHNYLVGPQVTNCDSLDIHGYSQRQSIELIRASKFRFDQSFRLTRKRGLQSAEFFSCNSKNGYLIITYNEEEHLYDEVNKDVWQDLISSSDPEGYYLIIRQQLKAHF